MLPSHWRWRREQDRGNRFLTNTVAIEERGDGKMRMKTISGVEPWKSDDPDTNRIWWRTEVFTKTSHMQFSQIQFPEPHCWLQKVRLSIPSEGEEYGDIEVIGTSHLSTINAGMNGRKSVNSSRGERRPLWMKRPLSPRNSIGICRRVINWRKLSL